MPHRIFHPAPKDGLFSGSSDRPLPGPETPSAVQSGESACSACATEFLEIAGTLLAAIPHPALVLDQEGVILLYNFSLSALLPEKQPRLRGWRFTSFLNDAFLPLSLAGATGKGRQEKRVRVRDKEYRVVLQPLGSGGVSCGTLVEVRDLSSPEALRSELAEVSLLLRDFTSCIDYTFDGISFIDGEANILLVNKVYEHLTGLKPETLVGRNMRDLVAEGVFDRSVSVKVLETRKPETLTLKINTGKTVLVSGNPLFDEHGRIHRILCSIRDMTELHRLQRELDLVGTQKTRYAEELLALKKGGVPRNEVLFRSESMRAVIELALRLGSVDSTVLLQGESGVGKEVIADLIHKNSLRRDKPFIKINCAAIPEHLLESELFGYNRGAFTGANAEGKVGIFEAADQGTLLLDEVGDLPLSLQVKLLRVIQEKKVMRLGDTQIREIDVRLLAATNQDLVAMTETGAFRRDLFYRLNVVPLYIPPLRERKEDVLLLIRAFLEKFCERHNKAKELHALTLPALLEHPWPGNVRELENIMERLVVTSSGRLITIDDLPRRFFRSRKKKPLALPLQGQTFKEMMDHAEAAILRRCFEEHGTTRAMAAALGINQSSVVRKMNRLRLRGFTGGDGRPVRKPRQLRKKTDAAPKVRSSPGR